MPASRTSAIVRLFILTIVLALTTVAGPAAADSAATFSEAVKLFTDKDYGAALPLFREVHGESKSPNARIYIARCLLQLGKLPEAYDEMKGTVADATAAAEKDDKYVPTRDSAAAELALLEPRIGKLIIAIAEPPDGVAASVNGAALEAGRLGAPLAVVPGTVTVKVEAPGKETTERTIDVPAGQMRTLALTLHDVADETPPAQPVDEPADEGGSGGGLRIAGFVVAGVGLAGIGVFAITAAMAQSGFDGLQSDCGGARCPDSEQSRVDEGRTLQTVANVSLGVGGALLIGGVAMIVFGGPEDVDDSESALTLTPLLGPKVAGLGMAGSF